MNQISWFIFATISIAACVTGNEDAIVEESLDPTELQSHGIEAMVAPPRANKYLYPCYFQCDEHGPNLCSVRYYLGNVQFQTFINKCKLDEFNCINKDCEYVAFTKHGESCEAIRLPVSNIGRGSHLFGDRSTIRGSRPSRAGRG